MDWARILSTSSHHPIFQEILRKLEEPGGEIFLTRFNSLAQAFLIAGMKQKFPHPILVITPHQKQAEILEGALSTFLKQREEILLFPELETLPYEKFSSSPEITGERLRVLGCLFFPTPVLVVTSLNALSQKVISPSSFSRQFFQIKRGEKLSDRSFIKKLIDEGYQQVAMVEEKGEMSVRGAIIDFFPPYSEYPVRIETAFDKIVSLREFDPTTQCSLREIEKVSLFPFKSTELPQASLLDYLPPQSVIFLSENEELEKVGEKLTQQFKKLKEENFSLTSRESSFFFWSELKGRLFSFRRVYFSALSPFQGKKEYFSFFKSVETFSGRLSPLAAKIKNWLREDFLVVLVCQNQGQISRLCELMQNYDLQIEEMEKAAGGVVITAGEISEGLLAEELKLVILSDQKIFGRYLTTPRKPRRKKASTGFRLKDLFALREGDYVVHLDHGIGQYQGMKKLKIEGTESDYVVLSYLDNDKLYLPFYQLHLIEKYRGGEGVKPKLNKLGTSTWARTRQRVQRGIDKLARSLLELYGERLAKEKKPFSPDTSWQKEFEESFIFEETPDQIEAVKAVKRDMESRKPMDRLICGDVGYGKTEVAMRASFKAVMDHKQVAILVPTTILAEQHYLTFKERFADYPIKIEMLSRFRSKKEQDKIISELKRGIVDIIIGTHRLIQGDIEFRDLGLVIIDEEQRFGLRHKEKLKQIKRLVDVLTLTATPIPRTLYLSLSGARDLSTIETPPLNRLAIQTFVLPFHRATVKEAILRELNRQGQVFFVHNRVKSITLAARYIKSLIPEAKVAIAHGQMKGKDLEKVMHQFLHQQIDVLVATSIIESGLDFPNVNTILINNAHRFGLADLYQLRGRVGRSYHQAYAYLFYPPYQPLTKEARKRLQTIEEFSELSAGFKIALRDLEIRGAGNLLGPEQHGFITSVGFDLYCQLLRETVARLKGEPIEEKEPVEVNIAFKGFIPVSYIEDGEQKLDFYKRLAWLKELEELKKIKSELRDRYGPWPKEVEVLLEVVEIKILAEKIGIKKINGGKKSWQIEWSSKREISPQVFSLAEKFDFKIKSKNPLRLEKISLKKNPFHELKKWLVELTR